MDLLTILKCTSIHQFGYKVSKRQVEEFLEQKPDVNDTEMLKDEFISYLEGKRSQMLFTQQDKIRQMFMIFDVKGQGYICCDSFKQIIGKVLPHQKPSYAESMFRQLDSDGDGCISFADFQNIMLVDFASSLDCS